MERGDEAGAARGAVGCFEEEVRLDGGGGGVGGGDRAIEPAGVGGGPGDVVFGVLVEGIGAEEQVADAGEESAKKRGELHCLLLGKLRGCATGAVNLKDY